MSSINDSKEIKSAARALAYLEGMKAYCRGATVYDNPYASDYGINELVTEWYDGFVEERRLQSEEKKRGENDE